MGCCGSKKKKDDLSNEPSDPPEEEKVEEPEPEPEAPRSSETQTLENQYQFKTLEDNAIEDAGPRKETLQETVEQPEPSVSVQEKISDEECTPLDQPSPVPSKAELEPIEPVKIPLTSHVDSLGPGDKNNLIVRAPMLSANEAGSSPILWQKSSGFKSKGGTNIATTDSYYTETETTEEITE